MNDKRAGQRRAVVRIDGERSGLTNAMDTIGGKTLVKSHKLRRIVHKKALRRVLETGCVSHQMAHEDRFLEALVRDLQRRRQTIVYRIVEAQLALFNELHDRDPHRRLRDRADAKERVGVGLPIGVERGGPVSTRHYDAVAIDNCDTDPCDMVCPQRFSDSAVHERLNGCAVDMALSLCRRAVSAERHQEGQRQDQAEHAPPRVSASAFRRRSDGFVNRRRANTITVQCSFGVGALGPSTGTLRGNFQHEKGARRTSLGGEGYFALAMEWRRWRGLRSFPTRLP
jgi:hypothetical protein